MRILWTIIWSFLLSQMLVYVVSSMTGSTYEFTQGVVIGVIFTAIIVLLGEAGVSDEAAQSH